VAGSEPPVRGEQLGAISRSSLPVAGRLDAIQRALLTVLFEQRPVGPVALLRRAVALFTGRVPGAGAGEQAVDPPADLGVRLRTLCRDTVAVGLVL
jgi:hypothetical protein